MLTGTLLLAPDVVLVPVAHLPAGTRARMGAGADDHTVTKINSRHHSMVVDAGLANLLRRFSTPSTMVDAVIAHAAETGLAADAVLTDFYPVAKRLATTGFLVDATAGPAVRGPLHAPGATLGRFTVRACLQSLEDVDVYRAITADGGNIVVKLAREDAARRLIEHESLMLDRLRELPVIPAPRGRGEDSQGRPFLALDWVDGENVVAATAPLRARRETPEIIRQGVRLLRAYGLVHAAGVVHADVHSGNVLLDAAGPRLIDFGLARLTTAVDGYRPPRRGGVAFYLEPEYARARLGGAPAPEATAHSDQYALAVLLYRLITGEHHLDFAIEKEAMYRQIVTAEPLPFERHGLTGWDAAEQVLRTALAKAPEERFPDVTAFADALEGTLGRPGPRRPEPEPDVVETLLPGGRVFEAAALPDPSASLVYGGAGVALGLYRLACRTGSAALLAAADVWIRRAEHGASSPEAFHSPAFTGEPSKISRASLFHGPAGVHVTRVLISQASGDVNGVERGLALFREVSARSRSNPDLTLGDAGILLGHAAVLDVLTTAAMRPLRDLVLDDAARHYRRFCSLAARLGHEFAALGAAHGWGGLLHAMLRTRAHTASQDADEIVRRRLDELAAAAAPDGAGGLWWPVRRGDRRQSRLDTSWCNGSAGMAALYVLAWEVYREQRYLDVADRAARHTAAAEPGRDGPSLCCGAAGRGYALLRAYQATGDARHRDHAGRAHAGARAQWPGASHDHSWFKGSLALRVLAEELDDPRTAACPLLDPETGAR